MRSVLSSNSKVFVAGHRGLVGASIMRLLTRQGFKNVITADRHELDLRRQLDVERWFADQRPEFVFLVAGTVGGIHANATRPAEFLYDNLTIHANLIHASHLTGVTKLLYLGSSCIYPRLCSQPMKEDELLSGPLEPTNEAYAIAKISGIKMCQSYRRQYGHNFIAGMPTNLYGPEDNFDLQSGHVLPSLLRRFHEAKIAGVGEVVVWGSGAPLREFLHVDDLASACLFLMQNYDADEHINIGSGHEVTIRDLATTIRDVVYPQATIKWDTSKPDGTPRKLLDVNKLSSLGWAPIIDLQQGIHSTYAWFEENYPSVRGLEANR